jgi:hypothetical protein
VQTLQQRARQQLEEQQQQQQQQQEEQQQREQLDQQQAPGRAGAPGGDGSDASDAGRYTSAGAVQLGFRFAILASGYPAAGQQAQQLLRAAEPLALPSLHVYSGDSGDRQVGGEASGALEALFDAGSRWVVRHQSGHLLPTARTYVATYRQFLQQHMGDGEPA